MKTFLILVTAGSVLFPIASYASQSAQARMWCLSLRFQQGASGSATLDLSTISGAPNGELASAPGQYTHGSYFILDDPFFFTIDGTIFFDVPNSGDANDNGFPDFFEVSQGVSGQLAGGEYSTDLGGGMVLATWNRAAGTKNGTCVLRLEDDAFGWLGNFAHTFELIEYTGPLSYMPGSNTVTGSVALTQTGNATNQLQGPVQFVKSVLAPFDELTLQAGGWTNAASQSLNFTTDLYFRDVTWPTNYYGYVEFDDGDPDTSVPDYYTWVLSIDDLNDGDHDGIPDFSDDPAPPLPRRPVLILSRGTNSLLLTISGDVGRFH